MIRIGTRAFSAVWLVDFEFHAPLGERQDPICMVAYELGLKEKVRMWADELKALSAPPFPVDRDSLFVAYYASAELGCFKFLNWVMPVNILDLFIEFRCMTNGIVTKGHRSLLDALAYFRLPAVDGLFKTEMRDLAIRGGPFTTEERIALLDYCESDVVALIHLLAEMKDHIDIDRALLRGRFAIAAAEMEFNGVPIDTTTFQTFTQNWESIQDQLIAEVDKDYGVYEGRTFKHKKFADYLIRNNLPWPVLDSETLDLQANTFKDMARAYPQLQNLHELRTTLSQLRLKDLAIGRDGRNRCLLSMFGTITGRNTPSSKRFIFGPATWIRGLIRPEPGTALAYVDFSQQEFGIAAALSGDPLMMEAYKSGDPYLEFAKQTGAVPPGATKTTHPETRELFKQCILGTQYGIGALALSGRIGKSPAYGKDLLRLHKNTYSRFWEFVEAVHNQAALKGVLWTVHGWKLRVGPVFNPRSLQNWPMQSNGADMLRLACCFIVEKGIKLLAPVHDAVLIEAPIDEIEDRVKVCQQAMAKTASLILRGFELGSDAKVVKFPDRYMDNRGRGMWEKMLQVSSPLSLQGLHFEKSSQQ
jgi:DNA polymerase I